MPDSKVAPNDFDLSLNKGFLASRFLSAIDYTSGLLFVLCIPIARERHGAIKYYSSPLLKVAEQVSW